jgi:hypothetical protein
LTPYFDAVLRQVATIVIDVALIGVTVQRIDKGLCNYW